MSEEWKKELLTKYFMATYNFSKDEAEKVIKDYFSDEITLDEEKVKTIFFFNKPEWEGKNEAIRYIW